MRGSRAERFVLRDLAFFRRNEEGKPFVEVALPRFADVVADLKIAVPAASLELYVGGVLVPLTASSLVPMVCLAYQEVTVRMLFPAGGPPEEWALCFTCIGLQPDERRALALAPRVALAPGFLCSSGSLVVA